MNSKFKKGDIINLSVVCNASNQKLEKLAYTNKYKLKVCSKPIKNKANKEIINYFKEKGYKIKLIKGLKSKNKIIKIIDDPK